MMVTRPILHILSGDLWAGKEVQVALQLAALRAEKVDVRVLMFSEGGPASHFRSVGIPVVVVEERHGLFSIL
ncbi:MAG: hypothetical protein KDD44_14925, partial [Bdellovibrionales bacterium]|nr:hypothetical protein [Bdellovibrionales bacterium]